MGYTNCDICNVLILSNEFQSTLTGKSYRINFRFDYNINRPINCTVRERKDLKEKQNIFSAQITVVFTKIFPFRQLITAIRKTKIGKKIFGFAI